MLIKNKSLKLLEYISNTEKSNLNPKNLKIPFYFKNLFSCYEYFIILKIIKYYFLKIIIQVIKYDEA